MAGRLAEKLRYARLERGLSQSELARRLELTQHSHINHLEAGRRRPSLGLVVGLAQILQTTTHYLLCDDIPVEPLQNPSLEADGFSPVRLGTNIRALRTLHGLTQVEATKRLQLNSQGYLSRLEVGKKEPSPELLVELAHLFSVTTDQLLFGDYSE